MNLVLSQWFSTIGSTFIIIFLAELGDKTQLVCMTLAARHRALPVASGALTAFGLLNLLAVVFGATLTDWIPEKVLTICVALLFAFFGIQALRAGTANADENGDGAQPSGKHNPFLTAFLMIFLAEIGDKTQIAAAALAVSHPPIPVWIGATLGVGLSVILAVIAGRTLLQKIPITTVQKASGIFFLLLAGLALTRLV
ncbi:MAG: TMEM165/GDT1 family protein [Magnetococcales bacterium]|nr:TMEM165/GDT1 family protein [Magnetococcales bacterium]